MKKVFIILSVFIALSSKAQNNALSFNSSTTYAQVTSSTAFNPTNITIEAWIKATSWRTNVWEGSIINKECDGCPDSGYMLRAGNGGTLNLGLSVGAGWTELNSPAGSMTTGVWYHVAGVYDGSNMYLYINGVEVASKTQTGNITSNTTPLEIGRMNGATSRYFNGAIDEVRIWNTGLDCGVINAWYNKTVTSCHPNYANLVGYWECDDNTPATTLQATVGTNGSVSGASYGASGNASFLGMVTGFQSTTASQPNTGSVSPGATNVEVLKIEVEVYSAMNATEFRLRTNGTTNNADISNAKLWYTGNSSTFSTGTQFGSTIAVPPGAGIDMVFSGSQSLSCGKYYFWLTYDVSAGATLGNVIDGFYQSSVINGITRTPTTNAPTGNRPIANTCNHIARLTDVVCCGWEGATAIVSVNGTPVLIDIALATGTGPEDFTFNASSGDIINITLTNSGSYPSEIRAEILDGMSNTIIPIHQPVMAPGTNGIGNCSSPTCNDPSALSATSITSTSAALGWTENGAATQWDIEWGVAGFSPTGTPTIDNTTNNPFNLTGLTSSTSYDFYVRADCGGITSNWAGPFNFNTAICSDPSSLTATSITSTSAALGWTENGTASQWDIEWGVAGFSPTGTPNVNNTTSNPYNLTGLTASTSYDFYVRADCGGTTSSWIGPLNFTTTVATYCSSYATSTADEEILNVTIGTLNNTSTCATTGGGSSILNEYSDFTALTAPNLQQGASYSFSVQIGTCGGNYSNAIAIFIDFNNDADFTDPGENVYVSASSTSGPHIETGTINIPASANLGNTRMRVVCVETSTPSSISSCGTYSWGETEDYTVNVVPGINMSFVSCTTSQFNTTDVPRGTTNREVIGFEIVTIDQVNPLEVTNFEIQTDGTTLLADITNAKIWYTGTSSSFITTVQFGSTTAPLAPGSAFSISGSQTLAEGTNYFWLTYDIPAGATIDNYIDAICNNITIDGVTQTPDVQNPLGNRKIIELVPCTHTLKLYDFDKATTSSSWGTDILNIFVDGVQVVTNATMGTGDSNGLTYTFMAGEGQTITSVYSGSNSHAKYVITGGQGDFIMEDGVENTVPSGKTAYGSCYFYPKFTINGHGYYNGETTGAKSNSTGDCITLTDEIQGQFATAWHNSKVDLSTSFTIKFELNFGDRTGFGASGGGDGIGFVFQDKCISTGSTGNGLGFGGIVPSLGIEFDTYTNGIPNNDVNDAHASIIQNGNNIHGSGDELTSAYLFGWSSLPTGSYREFTVDWDASSTTLKVYDGTTEILSYTGDIVNNIFGGLQDVYWGFTAATGESTNHHRVKVLSYPSASSSSALADVNIAPGGSVQSSAATGGASYLWAPNDGSINDPTIYNPTFSPSVTTTYTVTITDDCGNTQTDSFTITVGTLPIELIELYTICDKNNVIVTWQTASEENNDYFNIERSYDAYTWEIVGSIKGAGNSNQFINYNFIDKEVIKTDAYYRLKQVDFNGKYSYSETRNSICEEYIPMSVFVYPDLNNKKTIINFSRETEDEYILDIINNLGVIVQSCIIPRYSKSFIVPENNNLPMGTYIFSIHNNNERFIEKHLRY